ncbi:MAG: DNA polymerase III subunit beta [Actinomycetota bacterium]
MKLVCSREELSRGLQTALRSVGARAGIPALSGVLIELTDTDLSLTTTDLEITTRVKLALTGEAGRVLLPARLLSEIVRSLPTDEVQLITENGSVRVAGGRARFEIRSLAPDDFPRVDTPTESAALVLDGDLVSKALGQVAPAASRDETRPVLTGVLLEGEGDELRIVATDSYRLAVRRVQVAGIDGTKLLVPARAVVEVARLASGEKEIQMEVGTAQVGFQLGDVSLRSRLIEGEFPAYSQLLPEELPSQLSFRKEPFLETLKRVGVLAQDAAPVFLEMSDEGIRMTCHAQGLGEGMEEVEATFSGEEMRTAFNPTYLEAGIAATEGEEVVIEFSDPQRPALVHAPGDREFLYLLMPIRVS